MPPVRDLAHNPGTGPDRDSNQLSHTSPSYFICSVCCNLVLPQRKYVLDCVGRQL